MADADVAVTNGYQYEADSTASNGWSWKSPPSCKVYSTAADITVNAATYTAATYEVEAWDTDALHSTASNTSRINLLKAGKWLVGGTIILGSYTTYADDVDQYLSIFKNGVQYAGICGVQQGAGGVGFQQPLLSGSCLVDSNGTDYVEIKVSSDQGTVIVSSINAPFWAIWQSP